LKVHVVIELLHCAAKSWRLNPSSDLQSFFFFCSDLYKHL
jgi:hypothetical protein